MGEEHNMHGTLKLMNKATNEGCLRGCKLNSRPNPEGNPTCNMKSRLAIEFLTPYVC